MRNCFLKDSGLMLVIELVSKWEICWALWSLVLFDPVWRPNPNNIAWLFNGRFTEACWARLAHCGTTFYD